MFLWQECCLNDYKGPNQGKYMSSVIEETHLKPRILIVEDEWIISMELKGYLEQEGYNIIGPFDNGPDALNSLEKEKPDLALMDIKLNGKIDGIEVTRRIHRKKYIPVIYVTANTDVRTLNRAKQTNPFGYINKPFDVEFLNVSINSAMKEFQLMRQIGSSWARVKAAMDDFTCGAVLYNMKGQIICFNDRAAAVTEWKRADAIGEQIDTVYTVFTDLRCACQKTYGFSKNKNRNKSVQNTYFKTPRGVVKPVFERLFLNGDRDHCKALALILFDEKELPQNTDYCIEDIVNGNGEWQCL